MGKALKAWRCAALAAMGISGASAADIVLTPPASGGVSVTNAASDAVRFPVGEDGVVTMPGLGAAATSAAPLCIESANGKVGTCTSSTTSSTAAAKWLLKISSITAAAGDEFAAINWSATRPVGGNPSFGDIVLFQTVRTASLTKLIQGVFQGLHYPTAVVEYYAPPDTLVLQYTLNDVVGVSVSTSGSTVSPQTHTLSFRYGKITILDVAAGTQACWNVTTNAAC